MALQKWLNQKIQSSSDFDFQSLKLVARSKGKRLIQSEWGRAYTFFDLASLTKIVFTTLWFMECYQCDKKILSRSVQSFLPWYPHKQIKVWQLLSHSAGNEWWQPFYKDISSSLCPEQAYQQMEKFCQQAPISNSNKAVYSDLDFYLLGSIMQKVEGQALVRIWLRMHETFYPKSQFHFNYTNQLKYPLQKYAPTEKCPWRKKIMRGQVHDENCWALGGVAPHAGLFGRIEDLDQFGQLLRQIGLGQNQFVKRQTLEHFQKRSLPKGKGDWGLGFMKPSHQGSSAGELYSKKSFGHTGFTGTSFWFDPTRDLFVGLLSNRIHPSRSNKGFQRLRPQIHDWLVEFLEAKK